MFKINIPNFILFRSSGNMGKDDKKAILKTDLSQLVEKLNHDIDSQTIMVEEIMKKFTDRMQHLNNHKDHAMDDLHLTFDNLQTDLNEYVRLLECNIESKNKSMMGNLPEMFQDLENLSEKCKSYRGKIAGITAMPLDKQLAEFKELDTVIERNRLTLHEVLSSDVPTDVDTSDYFVKADMGDADRTSYFGQLMGFVNIEKYVFKF